MLLINIKKTVLTIIIALSIPTFSQAFSADEKITQSDNSPLKNIAVDFILATVGDDVLLFSDLQKAIAVSSQGQSILSPTGILKGGKVEQANKILESLIDQRVLSQKVSELGLQVTDDELQVEIDNFLKTQNITADKLIESLKSEGENLESYKNEFRKQLEAQRLIGRTIRPSLSATDDEIKSFYLQQPGVAEKQQRVKLKSLMIDLSPTLPEIQTTERKLNIKKIEKEIASEANINFDKLVKLYSNLPDAINGSELPPKEIKELPTELQKQLSQDLKTGTIIGPLTIGSSTFFFQYLGITLNDESEFEKQKSQLKNRLLETKGNEKLMEYIKSERYRTKIQKKQFIIVSE